MQGKIYRHGDLEFYAEDGMIHMHNHAALPGKPDEKTMSIREFKIHAKGCTDIANNLFYKCSLVPAERTMFENASHVAKIAPEVIKEALEQGDPTDPRVQKERYEEYKNTKKYTLKPDVQANNIILPD